MDQDNGSSMRRLGRWVGRIRRGFLDGLSGDGVTEGGLPEGQQPVGEGPAPEGVGPDGVAGPRRRVIARRTTIEELEIHEPGPDGR